MNANTTAIQMVLFDFGGVIAEEGFQQGLMVIAKKMELDPDYFYALAAEAVYNSGYILGQVSESEYWKVVRQLSGITLTDQELTGEILKRFVPRQNMLDIVKQLRHKGYGTAMLSDQSDWLDQLNRTYDFFHYFDTVFNSFHLGKSKRDPSIFTDVIKSLKLEPGQILFVDDNEGHIDRAADLGLQTHLFRDVKSFRAFLREENIL